MNTEYYYDSNPCDPYVSEYAWGRLAAVTFSNITYMYGYTHSFVDSIGRPNRRTETANGSTSDLVQGVQYGAAGQVTQMVYGNSPYTSTETRQYNSLLQLTRITGRDYYGTPQFDVEHRYSATQNNGRITQQKDWVSGEEVTYSYDSLQRLIAAATTGPEWGMSFTYDGFGNLTQKTVTKGSAPSLSASVDPATNRLVGGVYAYDANGNMTAGLSSVAWNTGSYDHQNRLAEVGGYAESFTYGHDNKRLTRNHCKWGAEPNYNCYDELYIYGRRGEHLATYQLFRGIGTDDLWYTQVGGSLVENIYFGGKLISGSGGWLVTDRLGSVRANSTGERFNYYPHAEERTTTANNRQKFGTYFRDNSALDYADQRYYSPNMGRFFSPDPSTKNVNYANPISLNAYAYVNGDPVNFNDPTGLALNLSDCIYVDGEEHCFFGGGSDPLGMRGVLPDYMIRDLNGFWGQYGPNPVHLDPPQLKGPQPLSEGERQYILGEARKKVQALVAAGSITQAQMDELLGRLDVSKQQYGGHWNLELSDTVMDLIFFGQNWRKIFSDFSEPGWRDDNTWDSVHIVIRGGGLRAHMDCANVWRTLGIGHLFTDVLFGSLGNDMDALCYP